MSIVALLLSASAGVALADGQATDSSVTKLGGQDITISDATITIADTNLSGPGFPNLSIDQQQYTLACSTMSIDGLHVSLDGKTYEIGHVNVTLKNIGVTLENVQISDSGGA
jgi:hypothetical protein